MAQTTNVLELVVTAEHLTGVSKKTGKKYDFFAFRGHTSDGKKCDFKFTREVDNLPKEAGKYTFKVERKNLRKDRSSIYNQYWISKVESWEPYERPVKEDEVDEELPF